MNQISGSLIHDFRTLIGQGIGVASHRRGPSIQFLANAEQLRVRAATEEIALQWNMVGAYSPSEFGAPLDLLREYSGDRNTQVALEVTDGQIQSRWDEAGIPKSYCFRVESVGSFPEEPASWMVNDAKFVKALADAAQAADREGTRFALSYLCLRGRDGRVAATDGRQLFAQTGFLMPWEEDCLVPVRQLMTCSNFLAGDKVEVGKTEDWIAVRSGCWTVWLKIKRGTRFPEIDFLVRPLTSPLATIDLSESDAQFLKNKLQQLPGGDSFHVPVTVDLNEKVVVRFRISDEAQHTELVLVQSQWQGVALSFVVDRRYLSRAIDMGFRKLRIAGPEAPLVSCQGDRTLVLAPMNWEAAIGPTPEATRLESPARARLTASTRLKRRAHRRRKIRIERVPPHAQRQRSSHGTDLI